MREPKDTGPPPGTSPVEANRTLGLAGRVAVLGLVVAGAILGAGSQVGPVWLLIFVPFAGVGALLAIRRPGTLLAFALYQPVRRRVQMTVDRRFDRARYDGDRTAVAFAARLREQVDLAGLEADIAGVVDIGLRPTSVSVWIRRAGHRGAA